MVCGSRALFAPLARLTLLVPLILAITQPVRAESSLLEAAQRGD